MPHSTLLYYINIFYKTQLNDLQVICKWNWRTSKDLGFFKGFAGLGYKTKNPGL